MRIHTIQRFGALRQKRKKKKKRQSVQRTSFATQNTKTTSDKVAYLDYSPPPSSVISHTIHKQLVDETEGIRSHQGKGTVALLQGELDAPRHSTSNSSTKLRVNHIHIISHQGNGTAVALVLFG